jgi:hypothetical protein
MSQPTPTVSRLDVERVIRRDFPSVAPHEVFAVLDRYGVESSERERDRVQLAVLKLARGRMESLRRELEAAKYDYRDTLSAAEYPGYGRRMFHLDTVPAEERQRVIDADWRQYSDWLSR